MPTVPKVLTGTLLRAPVGSAAGPVVILAVALTLYFLNLTMTWILPLTCSWLSRR